MPTVSAIIPTYQAAATLPRAVESVLDQTFTDLELIVVDDGSTDETRDVVATYARRDDRVRYCAHRTNRGASAARNTGIERARGELVAFLDADDEWRPRKLAAQVDRLRGLDADWVGVYCDAHLDLAGHSGRLRGLLGWLVGTERPPARREGGRELVPEILADRLHTHAGSSLVVRRETAEAVGGFDESFDRFQDPEFLVRVLQRGKVACVPDSLVVRHDPDDTPPAPVVEASSRRFLDTFAAHVATAEDRGYAVRGAHAFSLAKCFLREGRFARGVGYLDGADVTPRGLPGLVWAVLLGCYVRSTAVVTGAGSAASVEGS